MHVTIVMAGEAITKNKICAEIHNSGCNVCVGGGEEEYFSKRIGLSAGSMVVRHNDLIRRHMWR